MKTSGMAAVAAGVAMVWATTAYAGPCTNEITQAQADFDAKLNAAAAAGPSGTQTSAATMHRQPTLRSVAGAEEKLGDLSPEKVDAFSTAMNRAREADGAGNRDACVQALDEAKRTIAQ